MRDRIVLAYSGSVATSVAIPWLAEKYNAEVIVVTLDLGQGEELEGIRARALDIGATRAHVLDLREEFARGYVLPALQAGALYGEGHPMFPWLAPPLVAGKAVEIAEMERAAAIAHGCADARAEGASLDAAARALKPGLRVIAPARDWGMSRAEQVAYARGRGIPLPASAVNPYRTDMNLWGRSIEGGKLDDLWAEPPEEIFGLTRSSHDAPAAPAYVEISFDKGVPVAVNGVALTLTELIESLGTIAGQHGVGRTDMVENRPSGSVRRVCESPAAVVLHAAHRELEACVLSRELQRVKRGVRAEYTELVYDGHWHTSAREALDAFNATLQEEVTGTVRLRLFKGLHAVVGRRSAHGLCGRGAGTDGQCGFSDQDAHEDFGSGSLPALQVLGKAAVMGRTEDIGQQGRRSVLVGRRS